MTGNPFATEKAWEVNRDADQKPLFPEGDHVASILDINGTGDSSGGYPQIELKLGNQDYEMRDWQVTIAASVGRVVQLFDAVGIDRPTDEQVQQEGRGWRFDRDYLDQCLNRAVGIVVREEPRRDDPSRTRTVIKGYVPASDIGSDTAHPSDTDFGAPATLPSSEKKDDDYPF